MVFPVNNYTFTTGAGQDNGTHTFSATLKTAGNQTITATDPGPGPSNPATIIGTSSTIVTRGLLVTSVTPTPDGFTATFNKAFLPADITLFGASPNVVNDVVMTGNSGVGPVHGSLFIDPANQSITYKATLSYMQELNSILSGKNSVLLPDATYTVKLISGTGSNGFLDALARAWTG